MMKPKALAARAIKGRKVKNRKGEYIGKIKDVMIELESGKVLYAALSCGGFMGVGSTHFAIPMEALTFDRDKKNEVIFNVDKEWLQCSKGFDKNDWPVYSTLEEGRFPPPDYHYKGYKRKPPANQPLEDPL